ncbi:type VI secretion system contractile sheath large subunit, partial [Cronobacter sakazakii]
QDSQRLADASADERVTAAVRVFLERLKQSGQQVEKLDKTLLDHHIAELDRQISRQLDTVMHHPEFQQVESLWRGLKHLVDRTDYRQNVRTEILDIAKEDLRQDFEDAPEIIQSGLYWHTYTAEYDTPGGEPVGAVISSYEFDASAQDMALLRNISKVSAAAHMPFIGAVGPKFFLKDSMEEVAAIKDIGNYFDRAEYIKWKSFRDTDDARYIGLTLPRVLGRLPYGPDTVPVRSFNYVEEVKGPDHEKYLWTSASFAFAANMVKSFINNGWCVQIRGPQAGGAVQDLPIHLYDLGTGNQVKIPSEVMIPETREFEFANLGFIPLSYYKNRDYACFFSANSAQKPALYDTPDATANSRINARLPYIFLLSRIAHYLKLIQRENIGTTKDRRLLELELNNWVRGLVTGLMEGKDGAGASGNLSFQSWLSRVTQVRLKLQQITSAPDPQAMAQMLAQTVFEGKAIDLTDTRDYGSLVAASLGQEWSGFGQALFVQPLDLAWRQVLAPAASGLNERWKTTIVEQWNTAFAGRYPFKATGSDASLPILAQFLRADSGRIATFLKNNLGGILHQEGNRWVVDPSASQGMTVNPAFLAAINQLATIADTVFAQGDAGVRFELMARPSRDVARMQLTLDGQKLDYFNQMESWRSFSWPGETWYPGVDLSWRTVTSGMQLYSNNAGKWGFIRLLGKAQITPVDSSRIQLVWVAPDGSPLKFIMRTELGDGPLALLRLQGFTLPETIFSKQEIVPTDDEPEQGVE